MRTCRIIGVVASSFLLAVTVAGCTSTRDSRTSVPGSREPVNSATAVGSNSPQPGGKTNEKADATTPVSDDILPQIEFPLDDYRLSGRRFLMVGWAQDLVIHDCMARFGFDYPVRASSEEDIDTKYRVNLSNHYGITSAMQAKRYGYGLPQMAYEKSIVLQDQTEAFLFVLTGTRNSGDIVPPDAKSPGKVGGVVIPPGGCQGEASTLIYGNPGTQVEIGELAQQLTFDAGSVSISAPDIIAVRQAWVDCMAKKGYSRKMDLNADGVALRWDRDPATPPTAGEVQEALADVDCKRQVDYVNVFNRIQVGYQKRVIEQNQLALNEEKLKVDAVVNNAMKAIKDRT